MLVRPTSVWSPGRATTAATVAARLLAEAGFSVRLLLVGDRARLKGDAAEAARRWPGPVEPATPDALAGATVIVDALFGAGLDQPVEGLAAAMIEAMNASGAPVVAVDLPSGIHGDSGAVMGVAVRASETVTFFRRKPGHLLLPGRAACGPVQVADIGIPAAVLDRIAPRLFVNDPALWAGCFPVPRIDGHKYSRGHAVVVSGGLASTGAARLAARAALRAGAGLVTLASPPEALAVNAAASLAVMVRSMDGAAEFQKLLADRRINAVVLGPGGGVGAAMRSLVAEALSGSRSVVLDADALTSFAGDPARLFSQIQSNGEREVVLTPHQGEFRKLFKEAVQNTDYKSKYSLAIAAARQSGTIVLLKGPDTVVASPDGRGSIADNAPPWLATAGAGDVLAGIIAGLLAQGMPAFEAASAAVWLHGEAGQAAGLGLISEDLPEALQAVYQRLLGDKIIS